MENLAHDTQTGCQHSEKEKCPTEDCSETTKNCAIQSNSNDEKANEAKTKCAEWTILAVFCACYFLTLCCTSLQAPFFPKEAVKKGATLTMTGLVFASFQLTFFLSSLIYGSLLRVLGPKPMVTVGIFVVSVTCIAFGFLNEVEDPKIFIGLSFVLRITMANGNAAFVTAAFAIISHKFPDKVAKVVSYMETSCGLGLITAPAVGGVLYELGGFFLPFSIMGLLLLVGGIVVLLLTPNVSISTSLTPEKSVAERSLRMIDLFKIPTILVAGLSVFAGTCGIGYLLPTLEQHMSRNFNLPESCTGLIFLVDGFFYVLSNPLWGWLCHKSRRPRLVSLMGSIQIFTGFCLIGPIPILPWTPHLWTTCVGCILFGFGVGACFVSAFVQALHDAKSHGFPDDITTNGLVSGMWFAQMSLGGLIGASLGGFLVHQFGFGNGLYFVLAIQLFVATLTLLVIFTHGTRVNVSSGIKPVTPVDP